MTSPQRFQTTSWTLIQQASAGGETASDALSQVLERYWLPVFAFIRATGPSREESEDLTQSFFQRVIEKNYLEQADQSRGKFRSFILAAARHFIADERDRVLAQKRGGGAVHVPIDSVSLPSSGTPDQCFEQQWARSILERALTELRTSMDREGRLADFERLSPLLTGDAGESLREIAQRSGTTEGALRVALHRLRRRFGDVLRQAVAETVSNESEIDGEIRFLIEALGT